eukprot:2724350-Amphidinium_carterae.1
MGDPTAAEDAEAAAQPKSEDLVARRIHELPRDLGCQSRRWVAGLRSYAEKSSPNKPRFSASPTKANRPAALGCSSRGRAVATPQRERSHRAGVAQASDSTKWGKGNRNRLRASPRSAGCARDSSGATQDADAAAGLPRKNLSSRFQDWYLDDGSTELKKTEL